MNNKFSNPLDNIKVASPCSQDWDAMIGSERKRYCGECKLNVYNLSGMTRNEAENLIQNSEGRLCVRFYRRDDGTILTQDCPVGWRAVKVRATKMATAFASLIFGLIGGLGLNFYMKDSSNIEVGKMMPLNINSNINKPTPTPTPDEKDYPITTMGAIAVNVDEKDKGDWEAGKPVKPNKKDSKNSPQKQKSN